MKSLATLFCVVAILSVCHSNAIANVQNDPSVLSGLSAADSPIRSLYSVAIAADTITGTVYNDDNRNAINNSEPGLAGWTILLHSDSLNGPLIGGTTTDSIGNYRLLLNAKGNYFVNEVVKSGWLKMQPATAGYFISDLGPGVTVFPGNDFGNFNYGRIVIFLTEDIDGDSLQEAADSSALGAGTYAIFRTTQFNVLKSTDTLGNGVMTITVDSLANGTHKITQTLPPGWVQTKGISSIVVPAGGPIDTVRFMDFRLDTLSGTIFNDLNGNGINESEPGLSGWTVRLHRDTITNPVVRTATTDVNGFYHIDGVAGGKYVLEEVLPIAWFQSIPAPPGYYVFRDTSGVNIAGRDFGNFLGASISGVVFNDKNKDGIKDPDEPGLTGWRVDATNVNPALSRYAISQPGGSFTVQNLLTGTYTLSEVVKSGWSQSYPPAVVYTVPVTIGIDTAGFIFGNLTYTDSLKYRTFPADSFAVKAVRKKITVSTFSFSFTKTPGLAVNGLNVQFSRTITSLDSVTPFPLSSQTGTRTWTFSGDTIPDNGVVKIWGTGGKAGTNVAKWWWTYNDIIVGTKQGRRLPDTLKFFYPMPNAGNVRDLIFAKGLGPFNITPVKGLLLGVVRKDSMRSYGWVVMANGGAVTNTLRDKTGPQNGPAQGLTTFGGRLFTGQKSFVNPGKLDNRLIGGLLALKLNIAASAYAITPPGLGELVYEEGNNPLSGKMLRQIVGYADTAMTHWRRYDPSVFINLDTVIQKIDTAFFGPTDTVSFADSLKLTGVRTVASVSYLRPTPPGIAPRIIYSPVTEAIDEELPQQFVLNQNYPNPFNPTTTISYELPNPSFVTIAIYNMLGQEVGTLLDREEMDGGSHFVNFSADNFASGVYFYRIVAVEISNDEDAPPHTFINVKKMVLVR